MKKYIVTIVAVLMATTAVAGSFSSSRGGGFSSGRYSASPSRSFNSPSYRAPSRSFTSPTYQSPRYVTPVRPYVSPYVYRTPSTIYRAPIVEHHYYGGYGLGGSIMHNPFFWMWAMQPHQSYYAQGAMMPNGVMAGPGGGYYAAPVPSYSIVDSILMWFVALAIIGITLFVVIAIWRSARN